MRTGTLDERWLPAKGYEGFYEVSNYGRVKSLERVVPHARWGQRRLSGRILKDCANGTGHRFVSLWKDKTRSKKYVHRLVLEAFVGDAPEGHEACHIDDLPANNHLSNLRWGTRSDNLLDRTRNGKCVNANKTHCPAGHEYSPANTYIHQGRRNCRACNR